MTDNPAAADPRLDMDLPVIAAVPARTLGGQLHAARIAHGLTLPDIAARTRIPERTLVAIEADAYELLPHPTFAAGFIRSLAREVGVSEEEATARYRAENTRLPPVPSAAPLRAIEPDRVPSRRLAIGSGIVGVLAVAGALLWYSRGRSVAPVVAPSPAPVVASIAVTTPAPASTAPAPLPATTPAVTTPASATPALVTAASPPPAVGTPGAAVTLTAKQDVWLQIRDHSSGQRVVSTVLAQGQTYTVPPGAMELWTGRAGALDVRVNGKLLPPLGGPVETVRNVDLSAQALSARAATAPPAAPAR